MEKKKKQKLKLIEKPKKKNILKEIDEKLVRIFRKYIGRENMIFIDEIFVEVFRDNMENEVYKRYFWKDTVLKRIRLLRRRGRCFITCQNGGYFVLKNQDEADYYKDILERDIRAMKGSLHKADEWVEEEKWREI